MASSRIFSIAVLIKLTTFKDLTDAFFDLVAEFAEFLGFIQTTIRGLVVGKDLGNLIRPLDNALS